MIAVNASEVCETDTIVRPDGSTDEVMFIESWAPGWIHIEFYSGIDMIVTESAILFLSPERI